MSINSAPVQYKGEDLDPERGPGLGCFRFQLIVLAIFVVLTPLTVAWQWPEWISTVLLFAVVILLLVTGQTIIFLLRLVAADRRSRRRPLGSATRTVGELEDAAREVSPGEPTPPVGGLSTPDAPPRPEGPAASARGDAAPRALAADGSAPEAPPAIEPPPSDEGPVRQ